MTVISVLLVAMGSSGGLGCGGEPDTPDPAPASALRQRFPERAAQVLDQDGTFVATGDGFAPESPAGLVASRSIELSFPRDGREAIRIRGAGNAEIRVRELGVRGEGVLAERAVAYPRTGGTSFWTVAPGGVEEWLYLEASAVRAGETVAAWEVEGATVRRRGEEVELVDAGGVVRLSVSAPKAYAVGGRELGVRLLASGPQIELQVDADGEAVLVDPLWVFAGDMLQSRGSYTATRLDNGLVLATGGNDGSLVLESAVLFNPATNTWSFTGSMSQARYAHTATLLRNGKVLVTGGGGSAPGSTLASA
ncbi:MAG TPA: kelch repeat-containing protein, partial [Sorangium sp.]|nr:kelch repeat-containing protein [Sorangium sp.]